MLRTSIQIGAALAAGILAIANWAPAFAQGTRVQDPWPGLANQIFGTAELRDGSGLLALDMPERAEDASVVPLAVRLTLPAGDRRWMKALTLVIDENPSPVAASFAFGDKARIESLSTRVRINSYTNVHAVAELSDGKHYVVQRFVKASGGCSAPASKDVAESKAHLGEMRFREFARKPDSALHEAQLMIRHPNNSGLQMDQVTHLYVPAFFVEKLSILQGKDLILRMEGGISISENPSLRFSYIPNGTASFRAEAVDTEKDVFKGEWPPAGM